MNINFKPMTIVSTLTGALALVAAVIAFDSRYAKEEALNEKLDGLETRIISEMRNEVVKNRSVMITGMQREADDLEFQIHQFELKGETPPRYMTDKYKQILRQIATLKDEENPD